MYPLYLSEITTKDGLLHQGMYFLPTHPGKRALVWIAGLTGKFYGDVTVMNLITDTCEKYGWGFASFNTRGHDFISSTHRIDPASKTGYSYVNIGAGYEVFEECVFDIHAVVDFLVEKGFSEVFLVGHSTGALKVGYSEATNPHVNVKGLILSGALSDRLDPTIDTIQLAKNIHRMKQLIADGKGDEIVNGVFFFPMTPKRYISLFEKGSKEDVFDYGEMNPKMENLRKITKPLFVIISEQDEYLDRPAQEVLRVFDANQQSENYKSVIFPGANHGFDGKEQEFVETVSHWIASV